MRPFPLAQGIGVVAGTVHAAWYRATGSESDAPNAGFDVIFYSLSSIFLVAMAGLMSGLTLGLMSLDAMDLQVLIRSGSATQKHDAKTILPLLERPHTLLVTLLVCNAVAAEALPICLDRLFDPITAVALSVTVVLVFGEIAPQAICSRHGLRVGAASAPFVRFLMRATSPISVPIGLLLDAVLGDHHVALFKRRQLRALVDLHGPGGPAAAEGALSADEVAVIKGALDLTHKTARRGMTPLDLVYMLPLEAPLDAATVKGLLASGHSRVPVFRGGDRSDIVGVLLVKELAGVDVSAGLGVRHARLRSLPYLMASTPMYDMLKLLEIGRSHMVLLTDPTPEAKRARGLDKTVRRTVPRVGGPYGEGDQALAHHRSYSAEHQGLAGGYGAPAAGGYAKAQAAAAAEAAGRGAKAQSAAKAAADASNARAATNAPALAPAAARKVDVWLHAGEAARAHGLVPPGRRDEREATGTGAGGDRDAAGDAGSAAGDAGSAAGDAGAGAGDAGSVARDAGAGAGDAKLARNERSNRGAGSAASLPPARGASPFASRGGASALGDSPSGPSPSLREPLLGAASESDAGAAGAPAPERLGSEASEGSARLDAALPLSSSSSSSMTSLSSSSSGSSWSSTTSSSASLSADLLVDWAPHELQPVGIITIEDVLEELLQSEIVDETDQYVDNLHAERVNADALAAALPPRLARLLPPGARRHRHQGAASGPPSRAPPADGQQGAIPLAPHPASLEALLQRAHPHAHDAHHHEAPRHGAASSAATPLSASSSRPSASAAHPIPARRGGEAAPRGGVAATYPAGPSRGSPIDAIPGGIIPGGFISDPASPSRAADAGSLAAAVPRSRSRGTFAPSGSAGAGIGTAPGAEARPAGAAAQPQPQPQPQLPLRKEEPVFPGGSAWKGAPWRWGELDELDEDRHAAAEAAAAAAAPAPAASRAPAAATPAAGTPAAPPALSPAASGARAGLAALGSTPGLLRHPSLPPLHPASPRRDAGTPKHTPPGGVSPAAGLAASQTASSASLQHGRTPQALTPAGPSGASLQGLGAAGSSPAQLAAAAAAAEAREPQAQARARTASPAPSRPGAGAAGQPTGSRASSTGPAGVAVVRGPPSVSVPSPAAVPRVLAPAVPGSSAAAAASGRPRRSAPAKAAAKAAATQPRPVPQPRAERVAARGAARELVAKPGLLDARKLIETGAARVRRAGTTSGEANLADAAGAPAAPASAGAPALAAVATSAAAASRASPASGAAAPTALDAAVASPHRGRSHRSAERGTHRRSRSVDAAVLQRYARRARADDERHLRLQPLDPAPYLAALAEADDEARMAEASGAADTAAAAAAYRSARDADGAARGAAASAPLDQGGYLVGGSSVDGRSPSPAYARARGGAAPGGFESIPEASLRLHDAVSAEGSSLAPDSAGPGSADPSPNSAGALQAASASPGTSPASGGPLRPSSASPGQRRAALPASPLGRRDGSGGVGGDSDSSVHKELRLHGDDWTSQDEDVQRD